MSLSWLLVVATVVFSSASSLTTEPPLDWWQTTVFYQIYPRSFQDSDGDGTGDLKGITSRLEHLVDLGVGALWMSPIFKSPMADFGYDISNFYEIDPVFGTMADFDALVTRANKLGLKVILDFVPNHSSDESEWFIRAAAGDPEYSDYYVWRDPKGFNSSGHPIPPNEWIGSFFESVWTYVESRRQYYYHRYNFKQPDLNYRNEKVRTEMKNVLRYWLDRGAHGFRVDTVMTLVEDELFPDVPNDQNDMFTTNQPQTYEVVHEWRAMLDEYSKKDNFTRVLMTEAYGNVQQLMAYYGNATHPGAHFTFNFGFILNLNNESTAHDFVRQINEWIDNMPDDATANWVIGNHDQPRVATRYGSELAVGLAMITLLLPGVGVTYNGEEIGMVNNFNISYEDTQDPQGINAGPDGYMQFSRDFERTPFQWDDTKNAGFSSADNTWLPVHSNYNELNLVEQRAATDSSYNIYRHLLAARALPVIQRGILTSRALTDNIVAISRSVENTTFFVVVVNVGAEEETVNLDFQSLPTDLSVFTASVHSGFEQGETVATNQLRIRPKASVVLTNDPMAGSLGAHWRRSA